MVFHVNVGSSACEKRERLLGARLDEHRKNVKEGRSKVSKLAEHVWDEHHQGEIVGKEGNMFKRKIVEASFIAFIDFNLRWLMSEIL